MKEISELLELTAVFAGKTDQVQGPGGNTSVKSKDGTMWIKASGFRFEEMNEHAGISAVNSKEIADYFHRVLPQNKEEDEKQMLEIIGSNTLKKQDGSIYPKPSMETGFHAVLGNYVVHTHSVWSNLINCAKNRLELLDKLQHLLPYRITHLPFLTPGFGLSFLVSGRLKSRMRENEAAHDIYYLGNHGIIAHADSAAKVIELLKSSDDAIRSMFNIEADYPSTQIIELSDTRFAPESHFISDMLKKYQCDIAFFDNVLFPDQTVFFKNQISIQTDLNKKINLINGEAIFNCNAREANSINETLTAYLFIYHTLKELKLQAAYISQNDIDYINEMEMEKFRRGGRE